MTKLILTFVSITLFNFCFGQKIDKELEVDPISKTLIEQLLNETSIVRKIEFVEVERVKFLNFHIILVTNLKTGIKLKGLYLSNQDGVNFRAGVIKGERHAYLDEGEIGELVSFIEDCDSKWKNEQPFYQTQYEFETLDNLRVRFWTPKNSKAWAFAIKFTIYLYDNIETLGNSQSDDLLKALKLVREELKNH